LWELTLRHREDPSSTEEPKFSWGIPATTERVAQHFTVRPLPLFLALPDLQAFTPEHREAIQLVPDGYWKEFSAFSGPRLETVAYNNNTVLVGDASHPLLGEFALETISIKLTC
jgi:salicylate hydroxylase